MTSQRAARAIRIGAIGIAPAMSALLLLAAACGSDPEPPSTMMSPGTANPMGGAGGVSGATPVGGAGVPQAGAMASAGQGATSPMGGGGIGAGGTAGGAAGSAGSGPQAGMSGTAGTAGGGPAVNTIPTLYWLDIMSNRVMRTQDFMEGEAIVMRTGTAPDGVSVDVAGGKVYWTNMGSLLGAGGGSLQRANLDGSGVETIIPSGTARTPKQMQLDLVNRKLYFCDREGAKVWRAELDGSNPEAIVSEHGFQQLVGVALDVPAGKFYFSDRNGRKILRANIEMPAGETGANRTDIEEMFVFGSGAMPIDLDVDVENQRLYWTDRQLATVNRAGLDIPSGQTAMNRNDAEVLVEDVVEAIGLSLDVPNDKLYFSELGGTVSEAALDGSGARGIVSSVSATGVAIAHLPRTLSDMPTAKMDAIVEDDAQLAAALADAHLPTLITALAYMTGDTSLLREAGTLAYSFGDYQGGMSAELQARVRSAAVQTLAAYRDAGCPALSPRPPEFVRELMNFITAQPIAEHYLPFLHEELGLEGNDLKACPSLRELPAAARAGFRVIVIGAGMSGIAAAVRLRQAGVSFVVIEKNPDVGGTWFENSYPGCRVDSPNHLYSFSFEPNHEWPLFYSTQNVLYDYFRRVADKHGLREHMRFETSVEEAVWDDASALWRVRVRRADGSEETLVANAVISAVGQLNRPQYPDIPGRERFAGVSFHSARWDHGYDLAGKRVAVIGTGASAFQFIPEIAPKTRELLVFQRSAPWVLPTPNYHERVPDGIKWLLHKVPNYDRWYRFFLFWLSSDGLIPSVTADPEWQGPPRAIGAANDMIRKMLKGYIRMHVGQNPQLFEAAVPDYPPGGKRMLRDNGLWYATLKRDDVQLITTRIASISERGVVTEDGVTHEVDAIVYGTGFQASRFLQPMRISGRGGLGLNDQWAGEARAYYGMTVPSFPNLFLLYGPNTNIVVNGSIIFFSECAVRYVLGCIELLLRGGHRTMEVRREPHDRYNERVDAQNARMAWGAPGVRSWYKNASGRVSQNWPFPLVDFWRATQSPDPADFDLR